MLLLFLLPLLHCAKKHLNTTGSRLRYIESFDLHSYEDTRQAVCRQLSTYNPKIVRNLEWTLINEKIPHTSTLARISNTPHRLFFSWMRSGGENEGCLGTLQAPLKTRPSGHVHCFLPILSQTMVFHNLLDTARNR